MASLIKHTVLEPFLTGPLLYALTRGSPELRSRVLEVIAKLPFTVETPQLIVWLKRLFAIGAFLRVNGFLSKLALNSWALGDAGGRPWDWPNEIAVVTGGSGGLGSITIQHLAKTGMKIAIMDVSAPAAGNPIKNLRNVHYYQCDITNSDSVNEVAAKIKADLGAPTILLNNAGIGSTYTIADADPVRVNRIFQINLISHWYTTKAFIPDMIKGKKGHIVGIASQASFIQVPGMVDYCVTKAGVMSFHEGLSAEIKYRYKAPWIRNTVVHPYWVKTNLIKGWTDKSMGSFINNNPLTPLLEPAYVGKEIAKCILSGKGGNVSLPPHLSIAGGIRGWPFWLQEFVRDTLQHQT